MPISRYGFLRKSGDTTYGDYNFYSTNLKTYGTYLKMYYSGDTPSRIRIYNSAGGQFFDADPSGVAAQFSVVGDSSFSGDVVVDTEHAFKNGNDLMDSVKVVAYQFAFAGVNTSAPNNSFYIDNSTPKQIIFKDSAGSTKYLAFATNGNYAAVNKAGDTMTGTLTSTAMPKCRVYNSTAQTIPNNTWTAMSFDTEDHDVGDMHNPASNPSRITVPYDGYYFVYAKVGFAVGTANTARGIRIYVNGSNKNTFMGHTANNTDTYSCTISMLLNLSANDYVEEYVYQKSGGDLKTGSGPTSTSLGAFMVV